MNIVAVVGNPKPRSRTLNSAIRLAEGLGAASTEVIDIIDLGPGLLGWGDPSVKQAVDAACRAEVLIAASPTFKGTYSGLLKLFLDQVPAGGLTGVVAVPLMLGAGPLHGMAPDLLLKPILVELGATCPTQGLYVIDADHDSDSVYDDWLRRAIPQVRGTLQVSAT